MGAARLADGQALNAQRRPYPGGFLRTAWAKPRLTAAWWAAAKTAWRSARPMGGMPQKSDLFEVSQATAWKPVIQQIDRLR